MYSGYYTVFSVKCKVLMLYQGPIFFIDNLEFSTGKTGVLRWVVGNQALRQVHLIA